MPRQVYPKTKTGLQLEAELVGMKKAIVSHAECLFRCMRVAPKDGYPSRLWLRAFLRMMGRYTRAQRAWLRWQTRDL